MFYGYIALFLIELTITNSANDTVHQVKRIIKLVKLEIIQKRSTTDNTLSIETIFL